MASNFFIPGGTLGSSASCYIERDADQHLFQALSDGRYCFLLNSRQMGKSSLSVRTMARLAEAEVSCVLIDLTRIGGKNVTPDQWYATFCRELTRGFGLTADLPNYWKENASVSPMQRLFGFIRDVVLANTTKPLVVFIDEVDATLNLTFSTDEFFAGIREMYNRRVVDAEFNRITVCLVGVAVPTDLIKDPRVTPFNIGERIVLKDFTLTEVANYAPQLGSNGLELVRRIHYWTNGHPYLTQSICDMVSRAGNVKSASDVDALVRREFLEPSARETNVNLADTANRAVNAGAAEVDEELFRAQLLTTYSHVLVGKRVDDDESNRPTAILKLSGLVATEGSRLRVRNRIYRKVFDKRWVRENLPRQELSRQRAAYLRGVSMATGIGLVTATAFAVLSLNLVRQVRRADLNAQNARNSARVASENLLEAQREKRIADNNAAAAKKAESRINDLLKENTQALADAKQRLVERDKALRIADRASKNEHSARVESDRNADHSNLLALRKTMTDFAAHNYGVALRGIYDLEHRSKPSWELGFASHQMRRLGRYVPGNSVNVFSLSFYSNSQFVSLEDQSVLKFVDVATGRILRQIKLATKARSVLCAPGFSDAIVATDAQLSRISLSSGQVKWTKDIPTSEPKILSLSPNRQFICVGTSSGIQLRSTSDGSSFAKVDVGFNPSSVSISTDSAELALIGGKGFLKVFRTRGLTPVWSKTLPGVMTDRTDVQSLFSRNGKHLFVAHGEGPTFLFSRDSGELVKSGTGAQLLLTQVVELPEGAGYLMGNLDGSFRVLDSGLKRSTEFRQNSSVEACASSPDRKSLVTESTDGSLFIWRPGFFLVVDE